MQPFANLVANYQPSNKSEPLPDSTTACSKIENLVWVRMAEIYGHLWISNFGAKPNKSWCDMLATLSIEQIKYGLDLCKTRPEMPNLPMFKSLCKAMPAPDRFKPALPSPPVNREKVRDILDNLPTKGVTEAIREKRAREERAKALLWKQLHDPDYIAEIEARREKMLAEWQNKIAQQEELTSNT